ncbi:MULTISPECIES: AMP-binding protein [Rhodococcus]|uniref:acetate--CoA ligase n=1 Tax=Rhodococcus oxybenzonivorans TaxID=1990687 RepID=A0AAE5A9B4_9NOCA|nr:MULTISPECIES: AMP-binding protein [Rhodococcus]MDV7241546.1 AMP-binding protein [Rhodococcus oxybenzonivorans]MDV7268028.1 AMP-binding protein [Rhodococcus oxybenzonivorans]MDV7273921.1 AMP-binding protein [Rhodococcus oxybenzonivorans]MDV7333827.1 AMP-binding protein [Rhodococcus oxybenzonivorans]MDV7343246.1 AMP-binding protein [Rhodococcus oxybenzonivorans]
MSDYTWHPTDDYVENANVTRLARAHGLSGLAELRARSVADVRWYWDAVVRDLGLPFQSPYREVLDTSRGIEHPEWFVGGRTNVVDACLERWLADPAAADRVAVAHEAEDGTVRSLSYRELAADVERAAAGLRELGVGKGDAVALFLPMIPEAVVSVYAVARLGAVLVPLFSGFAPSAIASRIQDADAKVVIVADGTVRRRKTVTMKPALDEALAVCPTVKSVVVVENVGAPVASTGRDIAWAKLLGNGGDPGPVEAMDAGEPFALAYTSGTTGKPKGAVHTHAGFLVKTASEVAYSFDLKPGGAFCWITDMGWIMGPLSIVGTHANGGTLVLYEGSPDVPDTDRLWQLAQRHGVTMLGVSPTLIRTLRGRETDVAARYDLSSVHTIGSTGEPWDPDSYDWLAKDVFGGRVPVINFSGGTEVGGSFLAPYPVEPIHSCSLGGPSLGMDVDVVDDAGRSLRGEQGELVCRQPWPSMTRGVWKDEERYLEAYWSTFPGMWRHGDYALVDDDGQWYIRGRSDDVMNVAGKRLAPAEVEAVLTAHPAVSEAAAVGVPDPKKGEAVWAFWVPRADEVGDTADISAELIASVAAELGKPFAPSVVHRVSRLPKTRSAKILRRAVRAAALGTDPGDLSGAENPEAVDEIRAVVTGSSAT